MDAASVPLVELSSMQLITTKRKPLRNYHRASIRNVNRTLIVLFRRSLSVLPLDAMESARSRLYVPLEACPRGKPLASVDSFVERSPNFIHPAGQFASIKADINT